MKQTKSSSYTITLKSDKPKKRFLHKLSRQITMPMIVYVSKT
ncbi:MAG: hypothetical protein RR925_06900 [Erysipelotrichaceae bacterium]